MPVYGINPFDNFARTMRAVLDDFTGPEGFKPQNAPTPSVVAPVDVVENGDNVTMAIEIPGMRKEDLNIEVDGRQLVISGDKPEPVVAPGENIAHREREYGHFERSFTLGFGVDREKITADYKLGVLTLCLPKAEPAKARKIEVSAS